MNKIIMVILDGFGESSKEDGNLIKAANMSNYNELYDLYPHSSLITTGEEVNVPDDKTIDCEVSHLLIGAGKVVKQDITLCNEVLGSTLIEKNENLLEILDYIKDSGGALHLMGLVSDGKVYSDIRYMKTFLGHLKNMGVKKVYFHAITDGRDVPDGTCINYLSDLENTMKQVGLGKIATICGRSYAMDRNEDYNKTKFYINLLLNGKGASIRNYKNAIEACYNKNVYDENIPPIILDEKGIIGEGSVAIWLNFREDRAKQTLSALIDPEFDKFKVNRPPGLRVFSLLPIDDVNSLENLIDKDSSEYSLGKYLSDLGLRQARISEVDKFNNIGYYFNGCTDKKLRYCDNYVIPSYEKKDMIKHPGLNLNGLVEQTIKCMEKDYDFILVNIENPDIFGHAGNPNAIVESLNEVDKALGKIIDGVDDNFYKLIVTSDHGNVEEMKNEDGSLNLGHTRNKVPFIIRDKHVKLKSNGTIIQIAPTILKYMDIAIPEEMQDQKVLFKEEE